MTQRRVLLRNDKGVERDFTERTWQLMSSAKERGNKRKGWTFVRFMEDTEKMGKEQVPAKVAVVGPKGPTFIPKEIEEAASAAAREASANAGEPVTAQQVLETDPKAATGEVAQQAAAQEAAAAPAGEAGDLDDYSKITGIGPKVAEALRSIGARTYEDLAGLDPNKAGQALDAANLTMKKPLIPRWKEEAGNLVAAKAAAKVPA
jgi:predicted flap endonuclease-1-like 5' DNA nuclease